MESRRFNRDCECSFLRSLKVWDIFEPTVVNWLFRAIRISGLDLACSCLEVKAPFWLNWAGTGLDSCFSLWKYAWMCRRSLVHVILGIRRGLYLRSVLYIGLDQFLNLFFVFVVCTLYSSKEVWCPTTLVLHPHCPYNIGAKDWWRL